jgi:SAM-dependent methyltransferase
VTTPPPASAEYFDGWYAAMAASPRKDEIMQRHLGLPPHLLVTSSVTWSGIAEVVELLGVGPGSRLLDLACGRGGHGQEVALRTGAVVVGIDFSTEALRQAARLASERGIAATYAIGDLTATGLDDASVDAVLVVDSIQFATGPDHACAEIRRVLRPGGRAVLTGWEAARRGDERVPARLRDLDLQASLHDAGFADVVVRARDDWHAVELAMWAEAAALDPGDDPALVSFHNEGVRSLAAPDSLRRVLASATAG